VLESGQERTLREIEPGPESFRVASAAVSTGSESP